jgi:hypothetical protein
MILSLIEPSYQIAAVFAEAPAGMAFARSWQRGCLAIAAVGGDRAGPTAALD